MKGNRKTVRETNPRKPRLTNALKYSGHIIAQSVVKQSSKLSAVGTRLE